MYICVYIYIYIYIYVKVGEHIYVIYTYIYIYIYVCAYIYIYMCVCVCECVCVYVLDMQFVNLIVWKKQFLNKPKLICLHTFKQFQVLLFNTNNYLPHYLFVCTQFNGFKHCNVIQAIQFNSHLLAHS